jgi:GT2 family glycosyltransferase
LLANLTIPVLGNYDLLQRAVSSIDYPVKELLILDNSGDLESLRVPDSVKKTRVLSLPSNLGVATSWNLGIKLFNQCPVFFFASADVVFDPGDLEQLASAAPEQITLHRNFPHWQAFAIGWEVVSKIGLFDESLHPIYFEDTDYLRRAEAAEIEVAFVSMSGAHDNSSTIHKDKFYAERNAVTFPNNAKYYSLKVESGDLSEGKWDINRTRENSWAK